MIKINKIFIQFILLLALILTCSGFGHAGSEIKKDDLLAVGELNESIASLKKEFAILKGDTKDSTKNLIIQNQKLITSTNLLIKQVGIDRKTFLEKSDESMNWKNLLPSVIGALIGGLLAMVSAWFTLNRQHKNDQIKAKEEEKKAIDSLLKSIYSELDALWKQYMKGIEYWKGFEDWPDGKAIEGTFPISGEYFTIYNNTSHLIGRVKDDNLRDGIIRLYLQARGLMDAWKMNNFLNEKCANQEVTYQVDRGPASLERLNRLQESLKSYAPSVIEYHNDTEVQIKSLLKALEQRFPELIS